MNKIAFCAAFLLAATASSAQQPAQHRSGGAAQPNQAAEFTARDTNRDGKLNLAEWQDASLRKEAERFARIDANRDGALTQEEMQKARSERKHARNAKRHGAAAMREKMLELDSNQDQALSRQEIGDKLPRLAENFDSIDLDDDGKLSRDEMRAGRRALRQQAR